MNRTSRLSLPGLEVSGGTAAWLPASIFFLVQAFDYRSLESGGNVVQYLIASIAAVCTLIGARRVLRIGAGAPGISWPLLLVLYLIVFTLATMPFRAVDPQAVIRVLFPYFMFVMGGLLAEAVTRSEPESESRVLTALFVGGLISCAWTYFYVIYERGVVAIEGRHEFVSMAAPALFALGLMVSAFGLPQKRLGWLALVVTSVLFIMSTTRAFLVMMVLCIAYLGWISSGRWMSGRNLRAGAFALGGLLLGAAVLYQVAPEFYDRWRERTVDEQLESGEYGSVIAREAEWVGQMNALTSRPASMLFGLGIGSTYYLDLPTLSRIPGYEPTEFDRRGVNTPGHSYWIFSLYAGGAMTGWVMPLVLVLPLLLGVEALFRLRRRLRTRGVTAELIWHATMGAVYLAGVVAVFALTFSANPLNERYTCSLFGFCLIAARSHLIRAQASG